MSISLLRKYVALRAGYRDSKPVYLFACPTREDGLEKHIAVRVGYIDGKPVYAFTACLPAWFKVVALRQGYRDHKPVYLYSGDCCEMLPGAFSSSSSVGAEERREEAGSSSPGAGQSGGVPNGCCPNNLPETIFATLTNVSGCPDIDGASFVLQWCGGGKTYGNPSGTCTNGDVWYGFTTIAGVRINVFFYCNSTNGCTGVSLLCNDLSADCSLIRPLSFQDRNGATSFVCSPLAAVFEGVFTCLSFPGFTCVGGTVRVTITE